ncbi:MAG TPA: tetratricopeptide repeat protein [Acidimicrobiales bacterium]|nr:tetratricopeptide repeat protein [Acidimicrobiales bacterium]
MAVRGESPPAEQDEAAREDDESVAGDERAHDELARVLASPRFRRAPRMAAFLEFVVREALAGRSYRINERTVALEALGAPATFDPRVDPSVRVLARRVREGLDGVYVEDRPPGSLRIDLPKGGYVPRFVRTEATGSGASDGLPSVSVRLAGADGTTADRSIARRVAQRLGRMAALVLLGPDTDAGAADYQLLLTPSAGSVDAEVVAMATGESVWAASLAPVPGGPPVEAIVAGTVGDYVGVIHRDQARRRVRRDGEAWYDTWLAYVDYLVDLDQRRVPRLVQQLEVVTERHPTSALLAAVLAGMYAAAGAIEGGERDRARAQQEAQRALALDPDQPHATVVLAILALAAGDLAESRAELARVLSGAPDHPTLLFIAGATLLGCGPESHAEGDRAIQRSMALNECHPGYRQVFLAAERYREGDYVAALALAHRLDAPGWAWGPAIRAAILWRLGRAEAAQAALEEATRRLDEIGADVHRLFTEDLLLDPAIVDDLLADLAAIADHRRTAGA